MYIPNDNYHNFIMVKGEGSYYIIKQWLAAIEELASFKRLSAPYSGKKTEMASLT